MNKPTFSNKLIENTDNSLFVRALIEDSPIEMDWLWLADQLTNPAEKHYSYQMALFINPRSSEAHQGLAALNQSTSLRARMSNALDFLVAHWAFQHAKPVRK